MKEVKVSDFYNLDKAVLASKVRFRRISAVSVTGIDENGVSVADGDYLNPRRYVEAGRPFLESELGAEIVLFPSEELRREAEKQERLYQDALTKFKNRNSWEMSAELLNKVRDILESS